MVKSLAIHEAEHIHEVGDLIHDQPFRMAELRYDCDARALYVPFAYEDVEAAVVLKKGWIRTELKVPLLEGMLRVGAVQTLHVEDRARIEIYELNTLEYRRHKSELVLSAEPDARVVLMVAGIDVRVDLSDHKVGEQYVAYTLFVESTWGRTLARRPADK